MHEAISIKFNSNSLATLLRSNLSCHLGKNMTKDMIDEITLQIIESIDYFFNQKDDEK